MRLTRREWMMRAASAAWFGQAMVRKEGSGTDSTIETVLGPAGLATLGATLMHEHVLVDFIGADRVSAARYDADKVFARVRPFIERVREAGCRTIVDCTPAWLGRDPRLLQRLSKSTGVTILTNTGIYGAANDKFVPAHAWKRSAEELADDWIREARDGIDGTGIKPAFMKIGVDNGPLSDIDGKLVRTAAVTHRATGLPIASHTTDGTAAVAQLDLLESHGVPPSSFIWVHAQAEKRRELHVEAAERGAWVEFDGIADDTIEQHVDLVRAMRDRQQLTRVLVSQDAGWYHVGEPDGGSIRPFTTLFERFLPALRKAGLSDSDERQLLVENPRAALTKRRV